MQNPDPSRSEVPGANISQLVDALHALRDELVKTSLMLKDYQFHADGVQRSAAAQHANDLIERIKPR